MRLLLVRLIIYVSYCLILPATPGCQPVHVISPPGYDLTKPQRFVLSEQLHEISGIGFLQGRADTIYAIEDETARLFYFHPGDADYSKVKFGKKGDYEDMAIIGRDVVVLRSDGTLFEFPLAQKALKSTDSTKEYAQLLPAGEYEGLAADEQGRLLAMCKNCPQDKHKEVSIYVLQKTNGAGWAVSDQFKVNVSSEELTSEKKKVRFHPSALAWNPATHQWFILSSVNKALVVLDDHWKIVSFYELDPGVFKQPEGLAFDTHGNMYVSNEGADGSANVLLFPYSSKQ